MKETPGTRDVENPVRFVRTNLELKVDPQKAALLGVPTVEFDRAVRLSVSGLPAGRYKDSDGEQYDIMVRTPMTARPDLSALDQVRVSTLSGETLPLSQLATVEFTSAPAAIDRFNRDRAVTINAEVANGYNTDRVTSDLIARLDQMQWPRGYYYVPGGELESRTESFGGLQTAIIIALLGIIAILVLEFGSFKSTLIVLSRGTLRHRRRHRLARADGQHGLIHRDDRLHRPYRHRDEELDPARRLHQPAARAGHAAG